MSQFIRTIFWFFILPSICSGQTYAIKADRLINGRDNEAIANPVIIVNNNRIIEVNFKNHIPDSAKLIDLTGYTVLPGLIDVHTHLLADGSDYDKDLYENSPSFRSLRAAKYLRISLHNGFTTIRDVCTEGAGFADVDLSRAVDAGYIEGPTIIPSGKGIAITGNYLPSLRQQNWEITLPGGTQYVSGKDECLKAVREQIARGSQWIKVFADWQTVTFTSEELKTIVDEAKKLGVPVAAHAGYPAGIELSIRSGVRSIEHGFFINDRLIQMAIDSNVFWSPTVSVIVEDKDTMILNALYPALNKAYKKGLKIVLGTDIGSFSWTVNQAKELEYYVKYAGLKPMDAIKTGTLNAAEMLNRKTSIGQIAPGFLANIIAVKGNPLVDISLLQQVTFVMKEGKLYEGPK
jgi:imidazolonepropionase-like amidohydrolase